MSSNDRHPLPTSHRPRPQASRRYGRLLRWIGALLCAASPWLLPQAQAGGAHQHGVAQIDVAIETDSLSISLDIPLDDLVGFERAPRTDAERGRVSQALARLRDTASLISPDPRAACSPGPPEIVAPVLGLGGGQQATAGAHAELQAVWSFACRPGTPPDWVDLRLFEAFPRLQRIEVQSVTPAGQHKATLRRPAVRVSLKR